MFYKKSGKRILDIIVAGIALILLTPVLFITVIVLLLTGHNPVIFSQERPGLYGKIFKLLKLRTMTNKKDKNGELLPDKDRLTAVGKTIRKLSLDEIPQLWNVLKGEMSLIGPRPLLVEYLPLYNETQKHRHDVRPGITGWAQVNGRNELSWEKKFELDVWYVQHLSFWLDIKIIFLTLQRVFMAKGINQAGQATAEKFKGSTR